jgi:molybdopterin synthase catalytic subunit
MKIVIQTEDFDVSAEMARLRNAHVGALVSFVGTVREATAGSGSGVTALELEHYPGMTEKSLQTIAQQAIARWHLSDVVIIHRVGKLLVTDQIVLVVVAAAHRGPAFSACEFIIDYLKTEAPFWKKETGASGSTWVDARSTDLSALDKWK